MIDSKYSLRRIGVASGDAARRDIGCRPVALLVPHESVTARLWFGAAVAWPQMVTNNITPAPWAFPVPPYGRYRVDQLGNF
jgi:TPP-dependent indolepyruvate ferredoxin oxidoreductase alpha subunit